MCWYRRFCTKDSVRSWNLSLLWFSHFHEAYSRAELVGTCALSTNRRRRFPKTGRDHIACVRRSFYYLFLFFMFKTCLFRKTFSVHKKIEFSAAASFRLCFSSLDHRWEGSSSSSSIHFLVAGRRGKSHAVQKFSLNFISCYVPSALIYHRNVMQLKLSNFSCGSC